MAYADHTTTIDRTVGVPKEVLTQSQTATVSSELLIDTHRNKYTKTKETAYVANRDIESN
jgi:hypothetical protein